MFLTKMKGTYSLLELVKRKLGFTHSFVVESVGRSGGLAMLWTKDTSLCIVNYSQFHIHCRVQEADSDAGFMLISFYGRPNAYERIKSWRSLLDRIK